MFLSAKRTFVSIATLAALTVAAGAAQAAQRSGCLKDGTCFSVQTGRHYDAVAVIFRDNRQFAGDIRCKRDGSWELYDGWIGTISRAEAGSFTRNYCVGKRGY